MTEQHNIIHSSQTLEAMLAPVGRGHLHNPYNNLPDVDKHCSKFRPSAAPTIISHLSSYEYEYDSNLFTIYSRRVTIEADITLVFLFHNKAEQP
jgi:hypothetical protein